MERKPVVIPNPNDLETKFKKYLQDVEYERSLKSDHEVRHEREVYVQLFCIVPDMHKNNVAKYDY